MRLLCILILSLWLSACATTAQRNAISTQHRQAAQKLLASHNTIDAIEQMRLVMSGNPNIEDALLYADLLESRNDYKGALKIYKKAYKYSADEAPKQTLTYRLALLEATDFDNLKAAKKLAEHLLPLDSRYLDLQSLLLFKQGEFKQALEKSQHALSSAQNSEEKGWAYFHMSQIYYELRIERDTFRSLFEATNNGRGHSLVARITEYWESKRHEPFPKN